jgi:hypothetical protein
MTLEQLHSLTEDETAMLWFMVNKVYKPAIVGVEMEPSIFTSIKHRWLTHRVIQLKDNIKEEHVPIYESLKNKLGIET